MRKRSRHKLRKLKSYVIYSNITKGGMYCLLKHKELLILDKRIEAINWNQRPIVHGAVIYDTWI